MFNLIGYLFMLLGALTLAALCLIVVLFIIGACLEFICHYKEDKHGDE